ncbi:MAG: DUF2971 domain-containing protein [Pantoea dispersa]
MILYKYTDMNTANIILEHSSLKFSRAISLNDPFELCGMYYESSNPEIKQDDRYIAASNLYGILSLTRNPLNPLMWAHYGKGSDTNTKSILSHAGLVFGIDVNEAELNSSQINVLPAKYGSIIYTATKPKHPFSDSENHVVFQTNMQFNPNYLEALQRMFLYKSSHWSYEEEVRVVRSMIYGECTEVQKVNRSCFKEVYIGFRSTKNKDELLRLSDKISMHLPNCKIYVCDHDQSEWTFKKITLQEALDKMPLV